MKKLRYLFIILAVAAMGVMSSSCTKGSRGLIGDWHTEMLGMQLTLHFSSDNTGYQLTEYDGEREKEEFTYVYDPSLLELTLTYPDEWNETEVFDVELSSKELTLIDEDGIGITFHR